MNPWACAVYASAAITVAWLVFELNYRPGWGRGEVWQVLLFAVVAGLLWALIVPFILLVNVVHLVHALFVPTPPEQPSPGSW